MEERKGTAGKGQEKYREGFQRQDAGRGRRFQGAVKESARIPQRPAGRD